jgi:ATP-dependent helicase/nuclease subunit B
VKHFYADLSRPLAVSAARILADVGYGHELIDLGSWLVVVPGSRAGRLLLHGLLAEAKGRGVPCELPTVTTVGSLIEQAFAPLAQAPTVASTLERVLAWKEVLEASATGAAAPFVPRGHRPDGSLWHRLSKGIVRVEDDLDAAGRTFREAARLVEESGGDPTRLTSLAELAPAARERLAAEGMVTPREARDVVIAEAPLAFAHIALVGTLELAEMQRRAVQRFASRVVIVAGRSEEADRFDAFGGATAAWNTATIEIPDGSIATAETPRDGAELALRCLAERLAIQPSLACDEVSIALGDDESAAELALAAREASVDIHAAAGIPLLATPIGRTLRIAAAYRVSRSPGDLAALMRRPAVERMVRRAGGDDAPDPIAALDVVRETHLPATLEALASDADGAVVAAAVACIDRWLAQFDRSGDSGGAIDALTDSTTDALPENEHGVEHDGPRRAFQSILAEIETVPASLIGSTDRLELAIEMAESVRVPFEPRERAVEAIGWLELLFEPAPHVVVLGMNEGMVPSGGGRDGLLPESVRERLGMSTQAGRAARDAAILSAVLARATSARFIVLRRSEEGDPLTPSRLLLRATGRRLAQRVARLAEPRNALSGARAWQRRVDGVSAFRVPTPGSHASEIERMSVTAFRDYLACPTRFWLGRIEELRAIDDDPNEIAVPELGTIVHETMKWFGEESGLGASTESDVIAKALAREFDARALDTFGRRPLPAVRLQLEIMRRRLLPFAQWQARTASEGWRIHACERSLPVSFQLRPKDAKAMRISGRIDRIDRHAASGAYRIIDYKTSDSGKSPRESHRAGKNGDGDWMDLQLPLYIAGMRSELDADATVEAGYVRLPSQPSKSGWIAGGFERAEVDEALAVATSIVARIRAGEFPLGDPIGWDDPYEGILQRLVFGSDDGSRDGPPDTSHAADGGGDS